MEAIKAKEEYYNPDFFVGKWENTKSKSDTLVITKQDSVYYTIDGFGINHKMKYDKDNKMIGYNLGLAEIYYKRISENEIKSTPYGIEYRKVE